LIILIAGVEKKRETKVSCEMKRKNFKSNQIKRKVWGRKRKEGVETGRGQKGK
jgi:hypothetical protein